MRYGHSRLGLALCCLVSTACASGGAARSPVSAEPITQAELVVKRYVSVMDAVTQLRPGWTRNLVGAYLNGQRASVADLRAMPVQGVAEIAVITADDAVTKYGARLISGMLLEVRTGR